jgi:hypothetical protein
MSEKKWEYLVVYLSAYINSKLNDLGDKGWELVSVHVVDREATAIFKKEKK